MPIEHAEMVRTLAKSGQEILDEMTPEKFGQLRAAILEGLDAGSWVDSIKKQVVYNIDMKLPPVRPEGIRNLTPEKCHLLHMAVGIFGEAAELLHCIYEHVYQGNPLDVDNCIEELGDGEFYIEGLRQGLGLRREETTEHNVTKLSARYEGLKYSDSAAKARADKA